MAHAGSVNAYVGVLHLRRECVMPTQSNFTFADFTIAPHFEISFSI